MTPASCDIFCRVIDNYGDIGVCWRLAQQLTQPPWNARVRLWVDDLTRCQALIPAIDPSAPEQQHQGVRIIHWVDKAEGLTPAQVVIEAFACDPPAEYIRAMRPGTHWINLEYLSAESWVEACHALPSPQPNGHTKWFFFPGFTPKTGGLLREPGLIAQRDAWLADPNARHALWQSLHLPQAAIDALQQPGARQIFLFCYPHAPVTALLQGLMATHRPTVLLAAPGSVNAVHHSLARDSLVQVCTIPFVAQDRFDPLLWGSDLNCVRGEDSLVRALWAARPLLWHIYPQAHDAHLDKLHAWLARAPYPAAAADLIRAWNTAAPDLGARLVQALNPAPWRDWHSAARQWGQTLAQQRDLASALMAFIRTAKPRACSPAASVPARPAPTQRPQHTNRS